jgi:hypothetical protein
LYVVDVDHAVVEMDVEAVDVEVSVGPSLAAEEASSLAVRRTSAAEA